MIIDGLQPWIHAFGWTLVHFLWQGAAVGLAYAVVRSLVPRGHGEARYAIGLLALAALAVCPLVTLWLLRPVAMPAGNIDAVEQAVFAMTQAGAGSRGFFAMFDLSWLVAAWAAGVIVMTARALRQWRALEHVATRLAWREAEVDALFERVAMRFGGIRGVRVLVSRHLDTPTLIGWFNPVILLPAAVVLGFPRHQLELILAHELGHLRRHDHLVNLVQVTVETLLFYHPVVHWISREVRHDREVCCDRLVLRLTEGEPREYARTLAALENLRQLSPQLAVAASGGHLLDRVRRIVGLPSVPRRRSRGAWAVLACTAILLIGMLLVPRWNDTDERAIVPIPVALAFDAFDDDLPALRLEIDPVVETSWPAIDVPVASGGQSPSVLPSQDADAGRPVFVEPAAPTLALVSPPQTVTTDVVVEDEVRRMPEPVMASAVSVPGPRPLPRLLRRVDPVYPQLNPLDARGHVAFEFSVDAQGAVRDIRTVVGDGRSTLASAARRALRQWRFESRPSSSTVAERYRQDFVFKGIVEGPVQVQDEGDATQCRRMTGSQVCRPVLAKGLTTEVVVARGDQLAASPGRPVPAAGF